MTTEFVENDDLQIDESVIPEGEIVTEGTSHDYARMWDELLAAQEAQTNITVLVTDASRGGLVVDMGVRGFIPKSQIATRDLNNLERFIGESLEVKVVEANRDKGRVVLSERKTAEEKRAVQRAETMSTLSTGMLVDGVVRRIADFGAFVDIGGIDGLLHISDMSWEHVQKPDDILKVGDEVQVKILKIEKGGERISLGLKQLQEDPWSVARREFREDDLVDVTITSVTTAGAFAKVMTGVEGFIPSKEFANRHEDENATQVEVGQTVTVKIFEMRARDRKMTLSIRAVARERERQATRDYMQRQKKEDLSTPTLGDLFGDVFSKLKKDE
ncbi:MAG: 30S ribosomal protein S1 [Armatimonadota bacterium]